ncbi:hypothetical protein WN944_023151 [Citrus x changshan-huyou]|uniref:Uncharacterized protein n=2 Tax=Citrus TaxID=2706 RepID=A0ACB8JI74_CITSI|nr:hypothetical protein KPL71_021804 [Citrus sinensis]
MESHMGQGYKFQPSDELIVSLLKEKRLDPHFLYGPIKDIGHICNLEPGDLATESETDSEDRACYFFYEPRYKYRNSNRVHRRAEAGHWKITSEDSQIEASNGLIGTKKFLTFYRRSPGSKVPVKTDWVMHEYHVKDDPSYEKEFVLCCIKRKRKKKKKRGISKADGGEPSQQLVSPPQQSPSDRPISDGVHNTHTVPQQQPQSHNSIYYPGNPTLQNTVYPQSITNDAPTQLPQIYHLISNRNHNVESIPTNQPNQNSISYLGNRIEEYMYSLMNPTQQLISARNYTEGSIPINQWPQPYYNMNSHSGNQVENGCPTNPLLPPDSYLESQGPLHHPLVISNFAGKKFQEECLPPGEIKSYGGYNRLNDASFSAVQTPISQEQELKYSNSSSDNCNFSDCQVFSDDSPRAFQDENSRGETGQTLTHDFDPSKSDGEASTNANDSSDTNTADDEALVKELLLKKDECLQIGEFKLEGGNNRLNDASVDNCDFSNRQISISEQVSYLINSPRAFPDVVSREELEKPFPLTLTHQSQMEEPQFVQRIAMTQTLLTTMHG